MAKIPTFRSDTVATADSRRQDIRARTEGAESANDTSALATGLIEARGKIKDNQSETEASQAYLNWNKKMAVKNTELMQRNGTEAIGLEDDFKEYSAQVEGEIEFKSDRGRNKFYEKLKLGKNQYETGLLKYQAAESFESKNQVLEAEEDVATQDSLAAVASGSFGAAFASREQAYNAFAERNAGTDPKVIRNSFNISYSKSVSAIAEDMSKNGNVTGAMDIMGKLNGQKFVSDLDMSMFKIGQRKTFTKDVGKSIAFDFYRETTNLMVYEAMILDGVPEEDIPESAKYQTSIRKRDTQTRIDMTFKMLEENKYGGDQYYGEENNEFVDAASVKALEDFRDIELEREQGEVDAIYNNVAQLIHKKELNGDPTGEIGLKIRQQSSVLGDQYGRYKEQKELNKSATENTISIPGEYSKAVFKVQTGQIKNATEIWNMDGLDKQEKSLLVSNLAKFKDSSIKDGYDTIHDKMLLTMFNEDDVERLNAQEAEIFSMSLNSLDRSLSSEDINTLTPQQVTDLITRSASVGWSNIDKTKLQQFKEDAVSGTNRLLSEVTNNIEGYKKRQGVIKVPDFDRIASDDSPEITLGGEQDRKILRGIGSVAKFLLNDSRKNNKIIKRPDFKKIFSEGK